MKTITTIDIETTGYMRCAGGPSDAMLSFGYIRHDEKFNILSADTLYFYKPEFNIENEGALKVHGLTREFLKQYENDFDKNLATVYSIMYMGNIVGKNSKAFDIPFITTFMYNQCDSLLELYNKSSVDLESELSAEFKRYWKWEHDGEKTLKRGTLAEYAVMAGITEDEINKVYNSLPVQVQAPIGYHTALYDATVTFLVAKWAVGKELMKI